MQAVVCGMQKIKQKRILVLLRSIFHPLTVAHDSNIIWFLDMYQIWRIVKPNNLFKDFVQWEI